MYKKKLIEVALPLDAINEACAYEKLPGIGPHPRGIHLWWARRPLAAARAVIWSSLVDDPSSNPKEFPTEEAQIVERERLFGILEELVKWKNSNNEEVLNKAKAEILKSTNGNPPPLLDPFAGGGAIPLEAQRLGLEAHASDLNPVAVMINKAMIEIPPKFANQPPINPEARAKLINEEWTGAKGLAEDVRYYGEWMKREAFKRIGHLYPTVKDEDGIERTVIAWIWARTVKCPNPACGREMPLVNSFTLAKRKNRIIHVSPKVTNDGISYEIKEGVPKVKGTMIRRRGAKCICCSTMVNFEYIREEASSDRMNRQLIAIVAEGQKGKVYLGPLAEHLTVATVGKPKDYPESELPEKALGINLKAYGFQLHADLFTNRQLTAITLLCDLVNEIIDRLIGAGVGKEYARTIAVYLAFAVDRCADFTNSVTRWVPSNEKIMNLYGRQTIAMTWDYPEANIFSDSVGGFSGVVDYVARCIRELPANGMIGTALQADAQTLAPGQRVMISTDPPYYDNIGYADLSDFFYIWLRRSLRGLYPEIFETMLVPKSEELIANPFRFANGKSEAKEFFERGMVNTFTQTFKYVIDDAPMTVYYAFKQTDEDGSSNTSSTGWETMLSAIIKSGFSLTGTWPIRTEQATRNRSLGSNALASSIVLVCRKRPENAPICTRRDFINALKRELKPALDKLQASNIAPVDMAQSAIGPGMAVYSRYSKVLEADGQAMSVRSALQIINQELDFYFSDQDGELDSDSRFCVDLYTQYAFNEMRFGEADVLARAKNTSVEGLVANGVLHAQKGVVRLLTREEIPSKVDRKTIWLLTQQLTHALEKVGIAGAAKIVAGLYTSEPERARALAYRLYTIAERKGWASEAYAYNSLVTTWRDIQAQAAELQAKFRKAEQGKLFDQ
jgi:putative DNA methylase